VLLTSRPGEEHAIRNALARAEIDAAGLRFLPSPHESSRIGQYGPLWVERPGAGPALIDAPRHAFEQRGGAQVANDLAEGFDLPIVRLAMYLSGGNLISNGQGLAIATTAILDQNADLGWDEDTIRRTLRQALGIEQLVLLQTLDGEPSGHVEWFAGFTSADTVVVGQYVGQYDDGDHETNAAILDVNAKILEEVELKGGGKLRVERVPMPPPLPGVWRSYTPMVFLDGLLLVPAYPDVDPTGRRQALETYSRLLPDWKIVPIDMRPLEASGVTLRSLVLRMGR
jgi:agmatine/peptidylarginine deiminase